MGSQGWCCSERFWDQPGAPHCELWFVMHTHPCSWHPLSHIPLCLYVPSCHPWLWLSRTSVSPCATPGCPGLCLCATLGFPGRLYPLVPPLAVAFQDVCVPSCHPWLSRTMPLCHPWLSRTSCPFVPPLPVAVQDCPPVLYPQHLLCCSQREPTGL